MKIEKEESEYIIRITKEEMKLVYMALDEHLEENGITEGEDKVLLDNFQHEIRPYLSDGEKWNLHTESSGWMQDYGENHVWTKEYGGKFDPSVERR